MSVLVKINRYLRQTDMGAATFGPRAVNDSRLVADLRRGRQPRAGLVARIEAFIANTSGRGRS